MIAKQNFQFITSLILLFCFTSLSSQEIELKKNQEYHINHLLNKYIVDNSKLIDISNAKHKVYQNQFLGTISQVDVHNPLRILLFFKESNSIVYLNQELSPLGETINLDEKGNIDALAICSSVTNGFWIFNGFSKRLEYYNEKVELIHSSEVMNNFNFEEEKLLNLQMYGDKIYMNANTKGVLVFDIYGTYIKTLPVISANSFQVLENGLLFSEQNSILFYAFESLQKSLINQGESTITYARIFNSDLYYVENQKEKVLNIKKLVP